jgi:hypothetical protein
MLYNGLLFITVNGFAKKGNSELKTVNAPHKLMQGRMFNRLFNPLFCKTAFISSVFLIGLSCQSLLLLDCKYFYKA